MTTPKYDPARMELMELALHLDYAHRLATIVAAGMNPSAGARHVVATVSAMAPILRRLVLLSGPLDHVPAAPLDLERAGK